MPLTSKQSKHLASTAFEGGIPSTHGLTHCSSIIIPNPCRSGSLQSVVYICHDYGIPIRPISSFRITADTMWLDRLASQAHSSGSSTPQPASRPYSPLPRRTSSSLGPYSQRTGHSPRGSSLSLVSNDSNTSLLSQQRRPNASGLRQSSTAFHGPDPVDVLEKLLQLQPDEKTQSHSFVTEEDIELVPDFGGLSLRDLASSGADQDEGISKASSRQSGPQDCKLRLHPDGYSPSAHN